MTLETFISDFEDAVEDVESGSLTSSTDYQTLEQWDSLAVLTVIAMVDADYDVRLKAKELKQAGTLADLFAVVESKKPS